MTRGRRDVLLDTGPLVAVLDRKDASHHLCAKVWAKFGPRCLTTEAVLTEATHLVSRGGGPASMVLEFLLATEVPILTLDTAGHRLALALMRKYQDVPMDYADATLVVTAEWVRSGQVFTLDRRGFTTYRRSRGEAFSLQPPPSRPTK